jgi:hypothetical protein
MIAMITHVTDHAERARQSLAGQFRDLNNWKQLVRALVEAGWQPAEDAGQELINLRGLAGAEGTQLDGIGDLVGETRAQRDLIASDDDTCLAWEKDRRYRSNIRARIAVDHCSGSTEEVIGILSWLTRATKVRLMEYPRAGCNEDPQTSVRLWTNGVQEELPGDAPFYPDNLVEMMQSVLPAGVKLLNLAASPLVDTPFGFREAAEFGNLIVRHSPNETGQAETGNMIVYTGSYTGTLQVDPDYPFLNYFCEGAAGFAEGTSLSSPEDHVPDGQPHGSFAESLTRKET